jgi:hypothetical protein
MSDVFSPPPPVKRKPPRRDDDDRPFLVVSHKDEKYRVICHKCGQRLIDQGHAKQFPSEHRTGPDSFRVIMLTLATAFDDVGEIH